MNALPSHRRHGGFLTLVTDPAWRNKFKQVIGGPTKGKKFPGALCHNHASPDFPTPIKDDWTKDCDLSWSDKEKAKKYFSYQDCKELNNGDDGGSKSSKSTRSSKSSRKKVS